MLVIPSKPVCSITIIDCFEELLLLVLIAELPTVESCSLATNRLGIELETGGDEVELFELTVPLHLVRFLVHRLAVVGTCLALAIDG